MNWTTSVHYHIALRRHNRRAGTLSVVQCPLSAIISTVRDAVEVLVVAVHSVSYRHYTGMLAESDVHFITG